MACWRGFPGDFADIRYQLIEEVVVFKEVDVTVLEILKCQLSIRDSLKLHSACGDIPRSHVCRHSFNSMHWTILWVELIPDSAPTIKEEDEHESQHYNFLLIF